MGPVMLPDFQNATYKSSYQYSSQVHEEPTVEYLLQFSSHAYILEE